MHVCISVCVCVRVHVCVCGGGEGNSLFCKGKDYLCKGKDYLIIKSSTSYSNEYILMMSSQYLARSLSGREVSPRQVKASLQVR